MPSDLMNKRAPPKPLLTPSELRRSLRATESVTRAVLKSQDEIKRGQGTISKLKHAEERALFEAAQRKKQMEREAGARTQRQNALLVVQQLRAAEQNRVQALKEKHRKWKQEVKGRLRLKNPAPLEKAKKWEGDMQQQVRGPGLASTSSPSHGLV